MSPENTSNVNWRKKHNATNTVYFRYIFPRRWKRFIIITFQLLYFFNPSSPTLRVPTWSIFVTNLNKWLFKILCNFNILSCLSCFIWLSGFQDLTQMNTDLVNWLIKCQVNDNIYKIRGLFNLDFLLFKDIFWSGFNGPIGPSWYSID